MWKDCLNILLGLWLAISPWLIGGALHSEDPEMVWNCVLTGIGLAIFAGWAIFDRKQVWLEWTVVLFGIWLLIAPGTLNYTIPIMTWNNVAVGLVASILAISRIFGIEIRETTMGPKRPS